jgi:hypothetical protein
MSTLPEAAARPSTAIVGDADDAFRAAAAAVSSHPVVAGWLAGTGLLRRVVVAVDDVASGASPVHHLGFLRPERPFTVIDRTDRTTANPVAYGRYDLPTEILTSVDTAAVVVAYQGLRARLEAAHREVSPLNVGFHQRLLEAIEHLLATPIPEDEPALVPVGGVWTYVDPELEALSDAQRHLLRMGPRNARTVQAKLAELRHALDPLKAIGAVQQAEQDPEPAVTATPSADVVWCATGRLDRSEASTVPAL